MGFFQNQIVKNYEWYLLSYNLLLSLRSLEWRGSSGG